MKKEAGVWNQSAESTAVYVSDIPLSMSLEEFTTLFKQCGPLQENGITKQARVKLYTKGETSEARGDGIVHFTAKEAVANAITR